MLGTMMASSPEKPLHPMNQVFVLRRDALEAAIGRRPFLALPTEEIQRLYGAVELEVVTTGAASDVDGGRLRLETVTVLHRNYTWHTFAEVDVTAPAVGTTLPNAPRRLTIENTCDPDEHCGIFLDEDLMRAARRALEPHLLASTYELRLGGLLVPKDEPAVKLVYVARLKDSLQNVLRRGYVTVPMGSGELVTRRSEFDPIGRTLIDNLSAL